jgi:AraC-like DNA-binding protein
MYIPPSVDIWGFGDSTSLIRDVRMRFDRSVVEELLGDEWDRKKWNEPILLLYDERLRTIAELIWQECHNYPGVSTLYGESLTAAYIAGMFTSSRTIDSAVRSGLGRLQLKRTLEYIDANLLKELHLKELAGIVSLSASHFGRAFKTATGLPPHKWVMQRRVQLAQRLMKDSGKSISIAAHATGFLSQSHFTKVFHSVTGATPRKWLRDQGLGAIQRDEAIPIKLASSDKSREV